MFPCFPNIGSFIVEVWACLEESHALERLFSLLKSFDIADEVKVNTTLLISVLLTHRTHMPTDLLDRLLPNSHA